MTDTLVLVPLHGEQYRHLIGDCAFMLNSEWKRSTGMRERTLEQSNEEFPYNVIMVDNTKLPSPEALVGHARFTRVMGNPKAVYMSSVIIHSSNRGKGLGRKLMEMVDAHMKEKGFRTIYLRADVVQFYIKCGYEVCDPVQEVTNIKMADKVAKLDEIYIGSRSKEDTEVSTCGSCDVKCSNDTGSEEVHSVTPDVLISPPPIAPPPPPPPPPPPLLPKKSCGGCNGEKSLATVCEDDANCEDGECSTWMKKILS